jgi:hypothetical protein
VAFYGKAGKKEPGVRYEGLKELLQNRIKGQARNSIKPKPVEDEPFFKVKDQGLEFRAGKLPCKKTFHISRRRFIKESHRSNNLFILFINVGGHGFLYLIPGKQDREIFKKPLFIERCFYTPKDTP